MSQSDVFREVDEELRQEQMVQLWKKHGPLILTLVVLSIVLTGAWVFYQRWDLQQQIDQTANLSELIQTVQVDNTPENRKRLAAFAAEARPGIGTLANLHEAAAHLRAEEKQTAIAIYDGLAANPEKDRVFRDLATVLSVMNQVDEADPEALRARLDPLLTAGSAWESMAAELSGLLAVRQGQPEDATKLFERAATTRETMPENTRRRLEALRDFYRQ